MNMHESISPVAENHKLNTVSAHDPRAPSGPRLRRFPDRKRRDATGHVRTRGIHYRSQNHRPQRRLAHRHLRNQSLRESFGLNKDDQVILACGESTKAANHHLAAWAAAILGAMDPRWKLLLWGRGSQTARVKEFASRVYRGSMLVVAEDAGR